MHYIQLFDERHAPQNTSAIGVGGGGIGGSSQMWTNNVRLVCSCTHTSIHPEAHIAIRAAESHMQGQKGVIMYHGLYRAFS